ncbi:TetR/AcrR family transcriptional regulator [Nesterenkonia sp. MY13]|uniref:TetR/AcrR family transcriptional regulator n=1 Tax=Nesterenkonia sedimenti TaxID=1463632 RepID=A0A7X8TLP5_9MICC|nr:TetR/AcrR family transcriptional regulator [Nesterenkonia sedimenti]NLS10682.1 TetR/AcrR family transcriptional regulator [Nesterenkonia sedimenti]
MRESKREQALEAAKRVVQRDGVTAVSYESVAAEAGLTKGGLLYHFSSREELFRALNEYVAYQWEAAMEAEAGAPAEELTEAQRFAAYTHTSQNPERAELILQLEASEDPELYAYWEAVSDRWAPKAPQTTDDDAIRGFLAKLAADGMWFYEAMTANHLTPEVRARLVEQIMQLGPTEENP